MSLPVFLLARLDEDEAAAKAVPPLEHNFDMGGNRQDEVFTFGRRLPSSADGMGNWSPHRDSPTTRAHFSRWTPARVLADVEAKRRIVALHDVVDAAGGCGFCGEPAPCEHLRFLAAVYDGHPDYREAWKP